MRHLLAVLLRLAGRDEAEREQARRGLRRLQWAVVMIVAATAPLIALRASSGGFEADVVALLKVAVALEAIGTTSFVAHVVWGRWFAAPAGKAAAALAATRVATIGAAAALGALVLALPAFASGKWIGLVLETLVYVTIATGLNIALGMT